MKREDALLRLRRLFGDNLGIEVQPNNMKRGSNIFNDEIDQFFLNRQLITSGKEARYSCSGGLQYSLSNQGRIRDT